MSRFAKLADKPKETAEPRAIAGEVISSSVLSRQAGSDARRFQGTFRRRCRWRLHTCARRNGVSLQALMAEAFDDVLRKYGESPIGK
jgi:hypothetical protein